MSVSLGRTSQARAVEPSRLPADFSQPQPENSVLGRRIPALLALALTACTHGPVLQQSAPEVAQSHLVALTPDECRAVLHDDGSPDSFRHAVARSRDYLEHLPPDRSLPALDRQVTTGELQAMLGVLAESSDPSQAVCDRLRLYRVELPAPLLVTGYYEPELRASRERSARFRYPVYRTPSDLVDVDLGQFCSTCSGRTAHGRVHDGKLVPYYSRAEIDAGALDGGNAELAWLDDPVEAFFLHVQGSAVLRFDDGVHMQISYSSSNGRPYTSIGRLLVEQGKLARDAVSLPALKDYLRAHPDEQAAIMAANQRYIFFRTVAAGPVGSLGVPLTGGRSIAADAGVYPPGAPVFLRIARRDPPAANGAPTAVQRFAVIQDAGTAITGPGRVDVFWGTGATAEAIAGDMRNPGELYLVLPQ
jgi:membrane-bound lytic murein transglycosylase A